MRKNGNNKIGVSLAPSGAGREKPPTTRSFMNSKIIQHYRNGRNWGDSWYFITKMALTGNLLTDEAYVDYLDNILLDVEAITYMQEELAKYDMDDPYGVWE